MTSPVAPSMLATWVLRRLVSRTDADALIGDVVEDMNRPPHRAHDASLRVRVEWRMWGLIGAAVMTELRRAVRAFRFMLRDAQRSLQRSPGSTAFIVLVLTISIAAATVTFSVVDAVVLRPLPFAADQDLVAIQLRTDPSKEFATRSLSPFEYFAFKERLTGLAALGAVESGRQTLMPAGESEPLVAARVTASLFDLLKVRPLLGRTLLADDEAEGRDAVAVLSYEVWQRRFGGEPAIVGRSLPMTSQALDGGTTQRSFTVVGVMPRGFAYPFSRNQRTPSPQRTEMWTPYVPTPEERVDARSRYLDVVGRRQSDVRTEAVEAKLGAVAGVLVAEQESPDPPPVFRVMSLKDTIIGPVQGWMRLALLAVGLVLLIACVNVANLQLARASARVRELSIRASLGATRRHVIASLLVESVILSLLSVTLAILVSRWGIEIAKSALPQGIARAEDIGLDLRVLTAAIVAAVTTGVLFGVVPAWQASRQDLVGALKLGGTTIVAGRERWRAMFAVAQVAVVTILLVSATLVIASFIRVTNADLGFDRSDLLTVTPHGVPTAMRPDLLTQLRHVPGVSNVSTVENGSPPLIAAGFGGGASGTMVQAVDPPRDAKPLRVEYRRVSSDYFQVAGLRVLHGQVVDETDVNGVGAVIVDETTAMALFGRKDAVSAELTGGGSIGRRRVLAVVRDVRANGPELAARPQIYLPSSRQAFGYLVIRITKPAATVIPDIRLTIARLQSLGSRPIEIYSAEDAFRNITADRRFNATLMTIFGVLAVFIGAAGVYGVMASIVAQRKREIGVRLALGAPVRRVLAGVVAHALRCVAIGLAVGLPVAFGTSRIFRGLLFEVTNTDVSTYAIVSGLLLAVGVIAALVPALRASRVDPMVVLRTD